MKVESAGDVLIITLLSYHFDASNFNEYKKNIAGHITGHQKVLLDLEQLSFIDSVGLGTIMSFLKNLREEGGDLKLCNVSKTVRAVFEMIRLHRLIDILNSREEALQAFQE